MIAIPSEENDYPRATPWRVTKLVELEAKSIAMSAVRRLSKAMPGEAVIPASFNSGPESGSSFPKDCELWWRELRNIREGQKNVRQD